MLRLRLAERFGGDPVARQVDGPRGHAAGVQSGLQRGPAPRAVPGAVDKEDRSIRHGRASSHSLGGVGRPGEVTVDLVGPPPGTCRSRPDRKPDLGGLADRQRRRRRIGWASGARSALAQPTIEHTARTAQISGAVATRPANPAATSALTMLSTMPRRIATPHPEGRSDAVGGSVSCTITETSRERVWMRTRGQVLRTGATVTESTT